MPHEWPAEGIVESLTYYSKAISIIQANYLTLMRPLVAISLSVCLSLSLSMCAVENGKDVIDQFVNDQRDARFL